MYSTADIAKRLGCTVQALNKYRRKIEKRDQKQSGKPDLTDGHSTLYTEDEVALIAELAPKISVTPADDAECLDAELIDGDGDHAIYEPLPCMSLEPRRTAQPAVNRQYFDLAVAEQETLEIEQHTTCIARHGDALLSDFAVGHILAAAADIQRTIAMMKATQWEMPWRSWESRWPKTPTPVEIALGESGRPLREVLSASCWPTRIARASGILQFHRPVSLRSLKSSPQQRHPFLYQRSSMGILKITAQINSRF